MVTYGYRLNSKRIVWGTHLCFGTLFRARGVSSFLYKQQGSPKNSVEEITKFVSCFVAEMPYRVKSKIRIWRLEEECNIEVKNSDLTQLEIIFIFTVCRVATSWRVMAKKALENKKEISFWKKIITSITKHHNGDSAIIPLWMFFQFPGLRELKKFLSETDEIPAIMSRLHKVSRWNGHNRDNIVWDKYR